MISRTTLAAVLLIGASLSAPALAAPPVDEAPPAAVTTDETASVPTAAPTDSVQPRSRAERVRPVARPAPRAVERPVFALNQPAYASPPSCNSILCGGRYILIGVGF